MAARFPDQQRPLDTLEYDINFFFNSIIRCVNARRITVLEIAKNKRNEEIDRQTRRMQGRQQLEATKGEVERQIKENFLQETQENVLRELEGKLEEVRTPLPETRVVFRGDYGHLEQLIAALGEIWEEEVRPVFREIQEETVFREIQEETVFREIQEETVFREKLKEQVSPPFGEFDGNEILSAPIYGDMRPIVSAGRKGEAPGELWSPYAVAIDSNTNNIYVAEGHPFGKFPRISIFSERGEFLDNYTHKRMKCPEGIAIHSNRMYVTDVRIHSVFLFKIESHIQFVTKEGSKGTENEQFNTPTNLAVSSNGNVYVADNNNNRIQVLDPSLNYIQTLSEQLIEQPRDIKLTADSVYVLCSVSPCIRVFSYTGDMLRSLISLGYQQQVIDANYFCLDSQENIVISDNGAHNVKAFNKDGIIMHSIGGNQSDEESFITPKGLALNNDSNLVLVSSNTIYGLHIFSSSK